MGGEGQGPLGWLLGSGCGSYDGTCSERRGGGWENGKGKRMQELDKVEIASGDEKKKGSTQLWVQCRKAVLTFGCLVARLETLGTSGCIY